MRHCYQYSLIIACAIDVDRETVRDIGTQPGDGGDLLLDAAQGIGQLGDQVGRLLTIV